MNSPKKATSKNSIIVRFAEDYGVDQDKVMSTLRSTVFLIKDREITDAEMMSVLLVAETHGLNPFTKEIYAFYAGKGSVVPVVGVDGWAKIINNHPQFDGMRFEQSDEIETPEGSKPCPDWMECHMYRKDRSHSVIVREYLDEVYVSPRTGTNNTTGQRFTINGPWQTHTKRLMRHKTMVQAARLAFSFSGIFDEDEAYRIKDNLQDAPEPDTFDDMEADLEKTADDELVKAIDSINDSLELDAIQSMLPEKPSAYIVQALSKAKDRVANAELDQTPAEETYTADTTAETAETAE